MIGNIGGVSMSDRNVFQNLDRLEELIKKGIKDGAEDAGNLVKNEAKDNLLKNGSYRTGNLYNSIESKVEDNEEEVEAKVGTEVEYSHFVELGTSKMSPKPYLYPALKDNVDKIVDKVADAIRKVLK